MKFNRKLLLGISAVLVSLLMFITLSQANNTFRNRIKTHLRKPAKIDQAWIAYNNWRYVMINDGRYMYDTEKGVAGGEFPRGSGLTIVFSGGFWVGTLKNGVPVVSGSEPSGGGTEYQPGRIENPGAAFRDLTAEDPLSASNKVYVIDRSLATPDYSNWPSDAPKTAAGAPGLIADGQTWVVLNDLDTTKNLDGTGKSPNQGLGLQVTIESFTFNAGALSDVVYLKFNITNETNADYPRSFLSVYMDADVYKNGANDVCGVDTTKGLGYTYNAKGAKAPFGAVGIDFFQGPIVDSTDIPQEDREYLYNKFINNTSVLEWDAVKERYVVQQLTGGKIWLGATAFIVYPNGDEADDDVQRYNLLNGLTKEGLPKVGTGRDYRYSWPGNPVTASSTDLNVDWSVGGDQRMVHSVGPFTLKAGQTQSIWCAVVGGAGSDRLKAVDNMFTTDDLAQTTFTAGMVAPKPPDVPVISVYPGDKEAIISWQNNSEYSVDFAGDILGIKKDSGYTEDFVKNDFQGYRVYRSRTGLPGSYTMLAQYDKIDDYGSIVYRSINAQGKLEIKEYNIGDNTGLKYSYVDKDLINGQLYYYSVTAYDAQPYIAGPGSYDMGEDKTIVKGWATAVRLLNKKTGTGTDYIYCDSLAFITASVPKLSNYPLVYKNRNNDNNLLGDTLYVVLDTNTEVGAPPDTVRCNFVCNSKYNSTKSYDYDRIKPFMGGVAPVVGGTFKFQEDLRYGTGPETFNSVYNFNILSVESFPSYIPKPSGIPVSLETAPTANVVSVVPMAAPANDKNDAHIQTSSATRIAGVGDGVIEFEVLDKDKLTNKTYWVDFNLIDNSTQLLPASLRGVMAYTVTDSATGQRVKFDSKVDDPSTFYDKDGDGVYTAGTDSVFDDSYYCTVIGDNGTDEDAVKTHSFANFNGIKLKVFGPPRDYKNFYWSSNGNGPITANAGFDVSSVPGAGYGVTGDYYRDVVKSTAKTVLNTSVVQQAGGGKFFILCRDNMLTYEDACSTRSDDALRWNRNPGFWNRLIPNNFYFKWLAAATDTAWIQFGDTSPGIMTIPVEGWMDPATPNDTSDDVKLMPFISDHDNDGVYTFSGAHNLIPGSLMGDWFYWGIPQNKTPGNAGYKEFVAACAAGGPTYMTSTDSTWGEIMARQVITNYNGAINRPLATGNDQYWPDAGSIFTFEMTKPNQPGARFVFRTVGKSTLTKKQIKDALDDIKVVPNPFYARSSYQNSLIDKVVKFTHLPSECTIKIFTVNGDLVQTLHHNGVSSNDRRNANPLNSSDVADARYTGIERWNLKNGMNKFVASGMYIAVIDVPKVGKKIVKFAVIQEEIRINGPDAR